MELLHPWFLLGLISILIPIIIHLLQLRRPQRIAFTNTEFIQKVELVTVRQRKLQHLLVLVTRIIGLVALVLIFCQPFIPTKIKYGVPQVSVVDVLVDNSASMQVPDGSGSLFNTAVAQANSLGKIYSKSQFRLLNSETTAASQPVYQAKLAELSPLGGELFWNKISRSGLYNRHNESLYIFSDFQRSTFDPALLKNVSSQEIILVPQTGRKIGNIFVDSVWFDEAFVRVRTNLGLHIRLKNGGSEKVIDCPVKVFLGPQQVAVFRATVAGGQTATSVVQVQVPDRILARGRVVTEDMPVVFDNTYYFTVQATSIIRVLEIGSVPIAEVLYKNEPLFSYAFTKSENVNYDALNRANLVLVREVPLISDGLRDALRRVVARGGSVVVVPVGTMAGHASYQRLFRDLGVGTVEWEEPGSSLEQREVAQPNAQNPFFRDVLGAQLRAATMPLAAPVLHWARTGTDIMRLRDGESYLAEFASGTGKVYVFSAPFAKEYSDFTGHELFVPVLYKLAMRSFRSEQQLAYRLTRDAIKLSLHSAETAGVSHDEAPFQLMHDRAMWLPVQRVQGGDVRLDIPAGLEAPGFYQVQRAGQVLTTVALNASSKESELATYSAAELRAVVGPNRPNVRVLEGSDAGVASLAQLQNEHNSQPLWRYFLGLALVCLLAETLLLRFGRPRLRAARAAVAV